MMTLKLTNGESWKLLVWENSGWHWGISGGKFYIHEVTGGFSCLIASQTSATHCDAWPAFAECLKSEDPNDAVVNRVRAIREYYFEKMGQFTEILQTIELPV